MKNHFELFGLEPRFAMQMEALDQAYRELQSRVHPDRYVDASDAERRVAMQWSTRANEAYRTLRSPLLRARYLCELRGVDLQIESNTAMPTEFLMQQLEWREALQDARAGQHAATLTSLDAEIEDLRVSTMRDVEAALDLQVDTERAARLVRQWMFIEKFSDEVEATRDALTA